MARMKIFIIMKIFLIAHVVAAVLCPIPPAYLQAILDGIEIPNDMLRIIFQKPSPTELFSLSLVSKSFNELATDLLLRSYARYSKEVNPALVPDLFKLLPLVNENSSLKYLLYPVDDILENMNKLFSSKSIGILSGKELGLDRVKGDIALNVFGALPFFSAKYSRSLDVSVVEAAALHKVDDDLLAAIIDHSYMYSKDAVELMWRLLQLGAQTQAIHRLSMKIFTFPTLILKTFVEVLFDGMSSPNLKDALVEFQSVDMRALIILAERGMTEELNVVLNCDWLTIYLNEDDWSLWSSLMYLGDSANPIFQRLKNRSRITRICDIVSGACIDPCLIVGPIPRTIFVANCINWQTPLKLFEQDAFFREALSVDYNVAYNYYKMVFIHKSASGHGNAIQDRPVTKLRNLLVYHLAEKYKIQRFNFLAKEEKFMKSVKTLFVDMAGHPYFETEHHDAIILNILTDLASFVPPLKLIPLIVPCASRSSIMSEFEHLALRWNILDESSRDSVLDWVSSHRLSILLEPNLRKILNTTAVLVQVNESRDYRVYRAYQNYVRACFDALSIHNRTLFSSLFSRESNLTRYREAVLKLASSNLLSVFFVSINFMIPPEYMDKLYEMLLDRPGLLNHVINVLQKDPTASEYLKPILSHPKYDSVLVHRALELARDQQFHTLLQLFQTETIPSHHSLIITECLKRGIDEERLGYLMLYAARSSFTLAHLSLIVQSNLYSDAYIHWLILGFYCQDEFSLEGQKVRKILAKSKRSQEFKDAIAAIFPEWAIAK